jgi:hypothetical protein
MKIKLPLNAMRKKVARIIRYAKMTGKGEIHRITDYKSPEDK